MHAVYYCHYLVSGSLHLPLRVLFSFRSRYYCTIGLGSYLGLEASGSQIHAQYPMRTTQGHPESSFQLISTGLLPSTALHSRRLRVDWLRCTRGLQHHISGLFLGRIQFALCRVRSPLITASRLISFPRGTKMLQSPRFPILTDCSKEQEVPFGHRRINSSLRLPGAYRSLARPSSAPEPSHSPDSLASRYACRLSTRPDCT